MILCLDASGDGLAMEVESEAYLTHDVDPILPRLSSAPRPHPQDDFISDCAGIPRSTSSARAVSTLGSYNGTKVCHFRNAMQDY